MIGNNQYVNPWNSKEEAYLSENYRYLSKFEMAQHLVNRSPDAIKRKMVRMRLKRKKEDGLKIKKRMQSCINHWNYGKSNTEEGRKNMKISQQKRFEDVNERIRMKKIRSKQITPTKDTSIEIKIQNFLKQLGIEFFTHQYMKIEHGYQCDILIPLMNLVIECDGDYWHKYPVGNDIDHIRTSELLEKGFKVLRLWEFEIKKMDINEFQKKICL